jgi:hypothetical protein
MSVILECKPGDTFVCIESFHATPDGQPFSWDACRTFRVGEKLTFLGFRRDHDLKDHPSGWLVSFEAGDRKRYAATQTYFVTDDCWRAIAGHFHRQRPRALKRGLNGAGPEPKSVKHAMQAKKSPSKKKRAG